MSEWWRKDVGTWGVFIRVGMMKKAITGRSAKKGGERNEEEPLVGSHLTLIRQIAFFITLFRESASARADG